jgi:uncharacterized membrane protein YcaP (DUF421 family)
VVFVRAGLQAGLYINAEGDGILGNRAGTRRARHPFTMDAHELLMTAARAGAVYVLMLVVVRALGRRTIGNFSAFDLIVALMLGEIVDEMIYADVRFIQGTVVIVTIAALAYADSLLSYWDHGLEAILEGKPSIVVKKGEFHRQGMRRERMNEKDVLGALRIQGVRDMREVEYALVEHDGTVSVLPYDWAQGVIKADINEAMAEARKHVLDGRVEPLSKRTDSPLALDRDPAELR